MANDKTLMGVLQDNVPYYLAKYVEWYMTPADKREPWDSLCTCSKQMYDGKTPEWAEKNWLSRSDVQDAMQAYIKYFKKQRLTQLYQSMYDKAMEGDVRAADWVVKFSESAFFDESTDEINDFLSGVNIKGLGAGK